MNRVVWVSIGAVMCLALGSLGCRAEAQAHAAEASPAAKGKAVTFSKKVTLDPMQPNTQGAATVTIRPGKGFKWNKEYPARLVFSGKPVHVILAKTEFKQLKGDFSVGKDKTEVKVPMKAQTPGEETVTGTLKFSVCNDTTCVIEDVKVTLAVKVVAP